MTDKRLGYFQDQGREYVVTTPRTPRPWVNYFWNERFISCVNQHGGGDGAYRERAIQYIDPRGRNFMVRDTNRCFYLRDQASGDLWSPGWQPVQAELDRFECVHGLGYSTITSERRGIEARLRVFVPLDQPSEVWTVTLTNHRDQPADLRFYSFVDWLLMGYPRYCDYFATLSGEYYDDLYAAQCLNRAAERTHEVFDGFLASDRAPSGFETSRNAFLGRYGHINRPEAVQAGRLGNSLASCENLASALEHAFQLMPGESVTFNLFVGASSGYEMTRQIVHALREPGAVERAFDAVRDQKRRMCDRLTVETPDERVNFLINGWIKQQIQIYADVGSDNGRGFRDAMQLLWATAGYDPAYTRRMIRECLSHQYASGRTLRGWLPIDDHHYCDGPVWIAPVIDAYLKETGDLDLLDEVVPFFDGGEGTVWEHVLRGLRHGSDDTGEHGLTRMHFGDWNDSLTGIGTEGRGESIWASMGIVYGLKIAAHIATRVRQSPGEAAELLGRAERLTAAIDNHGWDGRWYLRAINDHGQKVGTHTEKEGRIYLLPQVWSILAGVADEDRQRDLLAVIDEELECDYGHLVQAPTYTRFNPGIGRITRMVPGIWENGTAYSHANGFKVVADCIAGRGDAAYRTFRKIMPDSRWNPSSHSGCEPYVMTNQVLGPENRRAGQSLWAWMTGASGWFYRAMTQWMIGVQPDYDGLRIRPCLPRAWGEVTLRRSFRGADYEITVRNPHGLETGSVELVIDGEPVAGNLVPIFADGRTHRVEATLERPAAADQPREPLAAAGR